MEMCALKTVPAYSAKIFQSLQPTLRIFSWILKWHQIKKIKGVNAKIAIVWKIIVSVIREVENAIINANVSTVQIEKMMTILMKLMEEKESKYRIFKHHTWNQIRKTLVLTGIDEHLLIKG